jgi:transposase-like protein
MSNHKIANAKPRQKSKYSDVFRKQVLQYYHGKTDNENIHDIAGKFKVHFTTIYQWLKNERKGGLSFTREPAAPAVESIASTISTPEDKPRRKYNKKTEASEAPATAVRFCPCCGTNIEAVALAMNVVSSASN